MFGVRWLRTRSCHLATRGHSSWTPPGPWRYPSLGHRLPQGQQDQTGRSRANQDGQQYPVQVDQGILVWAADVPTHGALNVHGTLLPVQPRRVKGQPVDGSSSVVRPCALALRQDRKPAAPVETGSAQAQIQPFLLGPRTTRPRGAFASPDGQISSTSSYAGRSRMRDKPRKLTLCTDRSVTISRKD